MKAFFENRSYSTEIPVSASFAENMDFVAHWHTDIEMLYVCEGSIGVGINSERRVLHKGEIAICGSNDIHYYESGEMTSRIILVIFKPEILTSFKNWPKNLMPCSVFMDGEFYAAWKTDLEVLDTFKNIFHQINAEMAQKKDLYPAFASLRIYELFLMLFRYFPGYFSDSGKNPAGLRTPADITPMQKAIKYLEGNYTRDITLERISREVNLSRFYFSRLFKKTTGLNLNAYLSRIRVEKAAALIQETRRPIIEIAYETGFCSIRTFNRAFKGIKGYAPQSLRHMERDTDREATSGGF